MRWTDRVISFTKNYLAYLPAPAPPAPAPETLYCSASGDSGNPLVFPMNAVRWLTPPRDIAALVTASARASFAAELYHFGPQARELGAEFYLLEPGEYDLTLSGAGGDAAHPLQRGVVRVTGPRAKASFSLPSRRLCTLTLSPRPAARAP